MIHLVVTSPLPELFGFSPDSKTLHMELPFSPGTSILNIFEMLAERHPKFSSILNDEHDRLIGNLVVFVDGHVLNTLEQRKSPLKDGCKITLFAPYTGG